MCRAQFRSASLMKDYMKKEKGFSLPIVMVMMLVLAVMVLAATQSFNTESRISSNDADKKMAMQIAEDTRRHAESQISNRGLNSLDKKGEFTDKCGGGLCSLDKSLNDSAIWEVECNKGKPCLDKDGAVYPIKGDVPVSQNPRFVIEWVADDDKKITFRVTARAWGEKNNTVVTVQSYVIADL